ncbi:DUF6508 domain-containing protein [Corynebacterium glutamicum]|uniref:Uncharacterized protein n=1 Tax=Corynebacterium glutamicum (strain R) TaxID=340322 RepID=A0AB72VAL3_CORGB|nr:DUF6508 domain-containing protein [Corynebacterium glutamicum]BAF54436.1 hypothetical protein cgR_1445 [Corynebacterium glutamicum R]
MRTNREFGWEEVGPSQEGERFIFSQEQVDQLVDINERFKELEADFPIGGWNSGFGSEREQFLDDLYYPLVSEVLHFAWGCGLMIEFDWPSWEEGQQWLDSDNPGKWDEMDVEMARKMVSALIRSDRGSYSASLGLLRSGNFLAVFDHLTGMIARGER